MNEKILEEIAYIIGEVYPLDKDGLNKFLDEFMPKIEKTFSESIQQARAEERERIVEAIEKRRKIGHTSNFNSIGQVLDDLLSSLQNNPR